MKSQDLLKRVQHPDLNHLYCNTVGCDQKASAGTSKGLNKRFCRRHEDFYKRHGSYYRSSYSSAMIKPYINKALRWLCENRENLTVQRAIQRVNKLYSTSGPKIEAFRLRGLPPIERSKIAWARLRSAKIDPMRPLAAWIAVELITLNEPQSESNSHFKRVQAAKLIHRMASGSHRKWEQLNSVGEAISIEMHTYPRSRGKVLVHIGESIEKATELLVSYHLNDIDTSTL